MRINSNLSGMLAAQMQINETTHNLSTIAQAVGDPEHMEATENIVNTMTEQIPQIIAYEMNAKGIQIQEATINTLLNLKA